MAHNLRRLRLKQGISQEKLATDAGVDRAFTGLIERGKENPSVDTLDKLAGILGVPLAALFAEPDPGEPTPANLKRGRRAKT